MPLLWKRPILCFAIWCGVAVLLHFGPPRLRDQLKVQVCDAAGLTRLSAQHLWDQLHIQHIEPSSEETVTPISGNNQTAILESGQRDLLARIAELEREVTALRAIPSLNPPADPSPLISTRLIEAQVLGVRGQESSQSLSLLVAAGSREGLSAHELVLEQSGILIDQGQNAGIPLDRLVTTGRALLGRTHQVGKWTTIVQPIVDSQFRTAVHLVRTSELGPVVGAAGILEGTGAGCRIVEVKGSEPVAVGDLVYTDDSSSLSSVPIYCGKVTRATITSHDTHWQIEVTPAWNAREIPPRVTVLQTELSDSRVARDSQSSLR